MKKSLMKLALITLFFLVPNISNLYAPGLLSTAQTNDVSPQERLKQITHELEEICSCDRDLRGIPAQLDQMRPVLAPQLDPTLLPVDVSLQNASDASSNPNRQNCFDCFAWQLFIDLNWPAADIGKPAPGFDFGKVGDYNPVVWETYKSVYDIFGDPNVKELPEWKTSNCAHTMNTTSAIDSKTLDEELQADKRWLTDQKNNVVLYEIRVNKDEYEYIRQNKLHNQEGIYAAFTEGNGISLPDGAGWEPDKPGSIEIKAAWRIVPADKLDDYKKRFKISEAHVRNNNGEWAFRPVALVGLHIVKKTPQSHQLVWATFEHKDNAPDVDDHHPEGTDWSFYDPTQSDIDYLPNWRNPPDGNANPPTPKSRPVQVRRELKSHPATLRINEKVHELIKLRFPDSVWLNYRLIDVQWPTRPEETPRKPTEPLKTGSPSPFRVANITMETYVQQHGGGSRPLSGQPLGLSGPSSCIGCHSAAARTPKFDEKFPPNSKWWTDYSTIFRKAKAQRPPQ
jgi:hypothetical protein